MRVVLFVHSLVSDWNHGNAHFLRGIVAELQARGCDVEVLEPDDGWSRSNLVRHEGTAAEQAFHGAFPGLSSTTYRLEELDLDAVLEGADIALVHEWNDPLLVDRVAEAGRRRRDLTTFFHDTHHRLTSSDAFLDLRLDRYDAVLVFGESLRRRYLEAGAATRVWTWHEAADVRTFMPLEAEAEADLVWIGNWGDDERATEIEDFILRPARILGLHGSIHGVRYPTAARERVAAAGLTYKGWLANHEVPHAFTRHRVTVHVPRRPYVRRLPGVPTIRVFEALACGIPLVCAPWEDDEGLFEPGQDFLMARDPEEMVLHLKTVLHEPALAREISRHGLSTIQSRHTCAHRVDELLAIHGEVAT